MIASLYQSTSRLSGKPFPPSPIPVPLCKAERNASLYEVRTEEGSFATFIRTLFIRTLGFCGRVRLSFNTGTQTIDSNLALYWNGFRLIVQLHEWESCTAG